MRKVYKKCNYLLRFFVSLGMYVIEHKSATRHLVKVKLIDADDYKHLTKSRFYFNWKTEKEKTLCKLVLDDEILGVMSYLHYKEEQRIEISLLAVSRDNRGKGKKYERIAGNLIAFTCREAIKHYGFSGCVSLVPKTSLKRHYSEFYGMVDAGRQLFFWKEHPC